jgi:periplasmic copper chaperone A
MFPSTRRSALRAGTITAVAAAAIVVGAAPAFAHVTAQPGQAEQGSYSVISLRVPNESDTAGTVKLEVTLPADHPITSVRTTPRPGWTATMTKAPVNPPVESHGRSITEAVRTVTWTADPGVRIAPGEFVDFPLSLGPLPTNTGQLVLPSVQTYDNGEVVAWDQPPAADGSEPERPAPSVTLTPASDEGGQTGAAAAAGTTAGPPASGSDTTARWLGGAGLLVGALGLGVGAGAVLRSRRTTGGDR